MTSPSDPPRNPNALPGDCATRLRAWLLQGALPDSAAGVSACTRADVDRTLGAGQDGSGRFGGMPRSWTRYTTGTGSVRVVWDHDRALIIIAEDISVHDVARALDRLGGADAQWESRTTKQGWAVMDYIHARRGLTLSVGQSIADPDGPRSVFAIYFYEPTNVDGYIALGGKDPWVRRFDPDLDK